MDNIVVPCFFDSQCMYAVLVYHLNTGIQGSININISLNRKNMQ